jgi:hypothetical protein
VQQVVAVAEVMVQLVVAVTAVGLTHRHTTHLQVKLIRRILIQHLTYMLMVAQQDLVHLVVLVAVPGMAVVLAVQVVMRKLLEQVVIKVLPILFMLLALKLTRLILRIMIRIGAVEPAGLVVGKVQLDQPVLAAHLEVPGQLGQPAQRAVRDRQGQLGRPVQRGRQEQPAQRELRVHKDLLYQVQQILLG